MARSNNARLVYVYRTDRVDPIVSQAIPAFIRQVPFNPVTYRDLQPGTVTFIDKRHARGVDFRAAVGSGLDLLIAC